jgi:vacuolar-type H+-ATPase subunit E/Vma4
MPEIMEKLATYAEYIVTQAKEEAEAIIAEAASMEEKALAEEERQLECEADRQINAGKANARAKAERQIVAFGIQNRRKILEFRENCADAVFGEVRRHVMEYTKSEEYPEKLRALFIEACKAVPGISEAQVFLRPKDMIYKDQIAAALPDIKTTFAEGRFALGGLMLVSEEKSRRVDLSFDSAFSDLSGKFSEITGFRVEE